MKSVAGKSQFRHGDVTFVRITKIPASARLVKGRKVVAHSETGHHHSFTPDAKIEFFETNDPRVSYLRVREPSVLEHHRADHPHEAFNFDIGEFQIIRPREYISEKDQRMVVD